MPATASGSRNTTRPGPTRSPRRPHWATSRARARPASAPSRRLRARSAARGPPTGRAQAAFRAGKFLGTLTGVQPVEDNRAMPAEANVPRPARLGEILLEAGAVTADGLKAGLARAEESKQEIGGTLVAMKATSAEEVLRALAKQRHLQFVSAVEFPSILPVMKGLSPKYLREYAACPIFLSGSTLMVATAEPDNPLMVDELRQTLGLTIALCVAPRDAILEAIERTYGASTALQKIVDDIAVEPTAESDDNVSHLRNLASEAPVVRLVALRSGGPPSAAPGGGHLADQADGGAQYRRAAPAPGRADPDDSQRPSTRYPGLHGGDHLRRIHRHAPPGPLLDVSALRPAGAPAGNGQGLRAADPPATRHRAGDRAHGLGQDDHPVRRARQDQRIRQEDHHDRGPRGVPAQWGEPDRGEAQDRAQLRERAQAHRSPGPRRHHGRRDPRPRDCRDRRPGRADGAPRLLDAPHQRRAGRGGPSSRYGRRAVPYRLGAQWRARPAARAPRVRQVWRSVLPGSGRPARVRGARCRRR